MKQSEKNERKNFIDSIDLEPIPINNDPESSVIVGLIATAIFAASTIAVIRFIPEIMAFVRTTLNSW